MPRLHALEVVLDDAGQDAERRDWQRLRDAGLPSHLDYEPPTNTPHVSVAAAPSLPDAAIDVAHARLGALLPIRGPGCGPAVLAAAG